MSSRYWLAAFAAACLFWFGACRVRTKDLWTNAGTPDPAHNKIVGVTTREGDYKSFDAAATIQGQVLYARVRHKKIEIPLNNIERYWVETSHFSAVRTISLAAGVALGVVVIVEIAKSAGNWGWGGHYGGGCCLFVYSWDGQRYSFESEAYTSSITRGLERDDYSALPQLRQEQGQYRLMISNDMDETQYTNFLELWVVDHVPGVEPRVGEDGTLYSITSPLSPISARDEQGNDLGKWFGKQDRAIWEPPPEVNQTGSARREIILTFPRPAGARRVKLVAGATYTLWSGLMGGQILQLLGRDLPAWYRRIDEDTTARDELLAWMARDELYALHVDVQEAGEWRSRGILAVGGPFAPDERVTPLDISRVSGNELRIHLRPPAGFWAFNSFAVDYGSEIPLKVTRVPIETARDQRGIDLREALRAKDDLYYEMPIMGERAWVTFSAPPRQPGTERAVFLHSRGYYRMHIPEDGEPDHVLFDRIMQEPEFGARLSAQKYAALVRATN